jgi:hypothetical protein
MLKKIEVEKNGRVIKISPAMLDLAIKMHGATLVSKVIKPTPKELIKAVPKSTLPPMEITKPVIEEVEVLEKTPSRKAPVKSKSTK